MRAACLQAISRWITEMPELPCEWLYKLATRGVVGTMRLLYR